MGKGAGGQDGVNRGPGMWRTWSVNAAVAEVMYPVYVTGERRARDEDALSGPLYSLHAVP